ncbi:hypothetical protein EKD04_009215 [Chloroflexales bacterium ZM16-3]|nr:hypothetical protein [Chloroflexales bacterium ZM16-3]
MPVGATDWLRSIGQEPDPDAPQEPERPPSDVIDDKSESGVPDWLRDVTPSEIIETMAEDVSESNEPPSQSAFDPLASNWLTDDPGIADDDRTVAADWAGDTAAQAETIAANDIPEWLRDVAPEPFDPTADQPPLGGAGGFPDWLSAPEGDDRPASFADDNDVPDWLRDVSSGGTERTPEVSSGSLDLSLSQAETSESDVPAWLHDAEQAPSAAVPAPVGDDVPAWLRDAEQAPSAAAPAPVGDDVPAWLHDAEQEPPAPAPADDDVPAWLRDAEQAPSVAAPAPAGDDVPAWLRDAEQAPSAAAPAPAGDDVPAWLRDAEQAPSVAAPAPAPVGDVPDWLRGAEQAPPAPAPAPVGDLPDWLRSEASSPGTPPADATTRSAPEDVPAWLSADSAEPTASPSTSGTGDMSLPSWLRGVADEPMPTRPATRPAKADEMPSQTRRRVSTSEDAEGDDFFRGTDLPDWLRTQEPEQPSDSTEGQALDWLTRLGTAEESENESPISGTQATIQVAAPTRRTYQLSPDQIKAVALLSRLVHSPYPTPIAPPAPVPLPRWQQIGLDRVLYALLAIVLLIGLIVPQINTPFQTSTPAAPGAAALEQQLASLGPDDVVLVAYEWNAQRSSELRPLAQAVTSQLIGSKTKLILLSTDLQGTLLLFDLRSSLRAAGYNIGPDGGALGGRDYVLLGYRPGGELALRHLAQDLRAEIKSDFEGNDATKGLLATNIDGSPRVSTLSDLSMIIVMADQPQDVQVWMEQVHAAARSVPITFLMPQEAEPVALPYLRMPNVYHLAGLQGALAMRALTPDADSAAIARATGQQSLAVLAFVILLIGGGLGVALARARRSRRGAA